DYALQHQLVPNWQPRLGPAHPRALSAAQDDAADANHVCKRPMGVCRRSSSIAARVAASTFCCQSLSFGLKQAMMPRELLTIAPVPSSRKPAATSAALPPCAP